MSATWGNNFRVSIFGESHGSYIGIVIDGIPSGIEINFERILEEMNRRAPGKNNISTSRKEDDIPEIVSGVFNGYTTGAPLTAIIKNKDHRSKDYSQIKYILRPGHADYTSYIKYKGYNDYRGSGHFSGRITAPLVFAGAIAKQILEKKGIYIASHILSVKDIEDEKFSEETLTVEKFRELNRSKISLLNIEKEEDIKKSILEAKKEGDSLGGIVECAAIGVEAGIGEPFFDSVESKISSIVFSIPAIKGIEFGSGFEITKMKGSDTNDSFYFDEDKSVKTRTNHNGGINGGISNGMPIIFRAAIKPTPSISIKQKTINIKSGENAELELKGRHDPIIVPRVTVVLESVMAIALLDLAKSNKS